MIQIRKLNERLKKGSISTTCQTFIIILIILYYNTNNNKYNLIQYMDT